MKKLHLPISALSIAILLFLLIAPLTVSAEPVRTGGGSGCAQFYTVRYGDTLYRIAVRFGTSVWRLQALNGVSNPSRIYAGQSLCIRGGGGVPFGFLYSVKWGDTLYSIGRRYGWSAAYLASVNRLPNPNYIAAGQVLLIPYH